jgi:hypothetical protein
MISNNNYFIPSSLSSMPANDLPEVSSNLDNLFDQFIDTDLVLDYSCPASPPKPSLPPFKSQPLYSFCSEAKSSFVSSIGHGNGKGRPRKKDMSNSLILDSSAKKNLARREQNRIAAERCRQKKIDLISSLQRECEDLRRERDLLQSELSLLRQHQVSE